MKTFWEHTHRIHFFFHSFGSCVFGIENRVLNLDVTLLKIAVESSQMLGIFLGYSRDIEHTPVRNKIN